MPFFQVSVPTLYYDIFEVEADSSEAAIKEIWESIPDTPEPQARDLSFHYNPSERAWCVQDENGEVYDFDGEVI